MTQKVVIDTDFGTDADDAIAIALAMASDEIEVQAFTVVGRQSIYRKRMLEDFLAALGGDCHIPPVYAGWDAPPPVPYGFSLAAPAGEAPTSFPSATFGNYLQRLGGGYQFNWFGDEGTLDEHSPTKRASTNEKRPFDPPKPPLSPTPTPSGFATYQAGKRLLQLLSEKDVDLIAIGPLTNLFQALTNPSLAPHDISIPQLTVMGVHLSPTPYGTTFISEAVDYNLGSDIVSALYVLNEIASPGFKPPPLPVISAANWVTADVTLKTWLNQSQLDSLDASKHPFMQRLVKQIRAWSPIQTNLFKVVTPDHNVAFLHDPLTVACAFTPDWCKFETLNLELMLTNNLGLRWIVREQPLATTISLNCAKAVNEKEGQTFQDWLVKRLLSKFS
jgi:inosine-uridine nucleoside N-ribohydrolase